VRNNNRVGWLFGIGVTAGLAVGLAIGRQGRTQRVPRLDAWQRALAEQWGEAGAAMLGSRVLEKYQVLYAQRPRFARRDLQSRLERDVLPGLALYQVMLEETGAQEDALVEVEGLFEVASMKNRFMPPLLEGWPDPQCFYLDVLAAYGAPELEPAFCSRKDK
jgi:hypothetical protein